MQRYLRSVENWFNKWRLKTAGKKCSFTIYSKGNIPKELSNGEFKLIIFNEEIPINNTPKYLGITFDRSLSFKQHVEIVREKGLKLLNILKCLSFKQWSLGNNEKLNVYKCLIRSTIEYAAPILILNENNIARLHGVQYKALQIIFKEKPKCSSTYLHHLSELEPVNERLFKLSEKYFEKNILSSNPLVLEMLDDMTHNKNGNTPIEMLLSV